MHIFVTGATGFLGRALTSRLLGDGHRVTAWTRSEERARRLLGAHVDILETSEDDEELRRTLGEIDAVINLAGESIAAGRFTEERKQALRDSRIGVTRRLADAMSVSDARPRVLLSASAVGYYGDCGDDLIIESDSAGHGFIPELCRDWEQAAARAEEWGTRVALMRMGLVLGRGGGLLHAILPLYRAGLGGRLGSGRHYMAWLHLDDLVEIFVRGLTDERMSGPINVSAPRPVENREFTRTLARALGRPALLPVPAWLVRVALGEGATAALASIRAVPARLLSLGHEFRFPELDIALADILSNPNRYADAPAAASPPGAPRDRGARAWN